MSSLSVSNWLDKGSVISTGKCVSVVLILLISILGEANAGNVVDITADLGDTIWANENTTFNIWFENSSNLGGFCTGFRIWSDDGATWVWDYRIVDINQWTGDTTWSLVTVVPGSRMDPAELIWDFTGLLVTDRDLDEISPDTILIGGASTDSDLVNGSLEHMLSIHFIAHGPIDWEDIRIICVDSVFIEPLGDFLFAGSDGSAIVPGVTWGNEGKCWPVKKRWNYCPDWDDNQPTSMTVDHCDPGIIQLTASDPEGDTISYRIRSFQGSSGTAYIGWGGEGTTCEVIYMPPWPATGEVGANITIEIDITDNYHALGECPYYTLAVVVTNSSPIINCGSPVYTVPMGNTVIKGDIIGSDPDGCDALGFELISGPGNIEITSGQFSEITGLYTWTTSESDTGLHDIMLGVHDGFDTVECNFQVSVLAVSYICGDANGSGSVNILDITYLINYIYKGGPPPDPIESGDADGSGSINLLDITYLINYLYKGGPAPVCP